MKRSGWVITLIGVAGLVGVAGAEAPQVGSAVAPIDVAQSKRQESWRAPALAGTAGALLRFQPLADARIDALRRSNAEQQTRRVQIGIHRDSASEAESSSLSTAQWQPVAGGRVAHVEVMSPGAVGLRVALRVDHLPDDAELRVAGDGADTTIHADAAGLARTQLDGNGLFWTAVTEGERQRIEIFLPASADAAAPIRVAAVSHLLVSMATPGDVVLKDIGDSGTCNINAVCRDGALGQSYIDTRNAVAWMVFQSGGTFVCTGTLLNDADTATFTPWFWTAHHCIGTQSEANTLQTFWRREAATCGGSGAGANIQVGGGAQLLYSQAATDGALLRLNGSPPAGAVFAGWNAAALGNNTPAIAIHHPRGDNKKYSRGTYTGISSNVNIGGQIVSSTLRATWAEGTTEIGSSGSGLFTLGDGGGYQLRGGLAGGSASCANTGQSEAAGNRDFYSRLELVFPSISQYIFNTGAGPTRDYTGQWDAAAESGRGLSLFQFGDTLFGLWFVYDSQGRSAWYQIENIWTGADVTSGRVVRWTGSPWGPTYNPGARVLNEVGTYTITFNSATTATFAYNVDGVNRTIAIRKLTVD